MTEDPITPEEMRALLAAPIPDSLLVALKELREFAPAAGNAELHAVLETEHVAMDGVWEGTVADLHALYDLIARAPALVASLMADVERLREALSAYETPQVDPGLPTELRSVDYGFGSVWTEAGCDDGGAKPKQQDENP